MGLPTGVSISEEMGDEEQREIAHRLLIELLAHQVALPVRWIDTQDAMLSEERKAQRFIEFGPSRVLGGLLGRTLERQYGSKQVQQAVASQYKVLAYEQDVHQITFKSDQHAGKQEQLVTNDSTSTQQRLAEAPIPAPPITENTIPAAQTQQPHARAQLEDVSISAGLIIRNLVSFKLKKDWQAVALSKSLKELTGGRSTMQNELVSDLGNEFGSLPDGLESLSLERFAVSLEPSHSGRLGKQSTSLIARFVSAKMPTGWSLDTIKSHISSSWALGPSRQDAILLIAATSAPAVRLDSPDAVKSFISETVQSYAIEEKVDLQTRDQESTVHGQLPVMTDESQLNDLKREQGQLSSKLLEFLHDHLGETQSSGLQRLQESIDASQTLQNKLDLLQRELGEEFQTGVEPKFDRKQARRFASSWNTARVKLLELCYNHGQLENHELDATALRFANCYDTVIERLLSSISGGSLAAIYELVQKHQAAGPLFRYTGHPKAPQTTLLEDGTTQIAEISRLAKHGAIQYTDLMCTSLKVEGIDDKLPCLHIKRKSPYGWLMDETMTRIYHAELHKSTDLGISFAGMTVLVIGAGPESIAIDVVQGLLQGGARVIMTTSRAPSASAGMCQTIYEQNGANGSDLLLLPFNQGSKQDCESMIEYIYSEKGLNRNLDAVIPFAAVSEIGSEIDGIGSRSELAHRVMLTNCIRVLGAVADQKRSRRLDSQPTMAILPFSPNHGSFGGDGLYSESKLGLESLLERFSSESWSPYLSVCGAVVGWTRGTGLMSGNGPVAEAIEKHGALTFSTTEMALNLLCLLTHPIMDRSTEEPLLADLSGGLGRLSQLKAKVAQARQELHDAVAIKRIIFQEDKIEQELLGEDELVIKNPKELKRWNPDMGFPSWALYDEDLASLDHLHDMVEPERVIVIVGFSELGPWGSSRTRWEKEKGIAFTSGAYLELAWMMGLIRHFDGLDKSGNRYIGWVDRETGDPINDGDIGRRYHDHILAHTGIRMIESTRAGGFCPDRKESLQEFVLEQDLSPFDATRATADAFKARNGDKAHVWAAAGTDTFKVQLKRGATVYVPKSRAFDSVVAGEIPTGFSPSIYGIPEDIASQIDPVTTYALCGAAEALYSAGITDPYEVYEHLHLSEFGLFVGSSLGGLTKLQQMYKDDHLDKPVPGDVMQETLFNTPAAWINMLLMGSAGPIKTLTGACATSLESLDAACESLLAGKTKMCLVGGVDDLAEEEAYNFSAMKATVNSREQLKMGRLPHEMSRPMSETRAGFVESHGCGMQLICTADIALKMGLPIYAVIASSTMASDGIGRSVPAPGQGILTNARESPNASHSPWLDVRFRRACMDDFVAGHSAERNYSTPSSSLSPNTPSTEATTPDSNWSLEPKATLIPSILDDNAVTKWATPMNPRRAAKLLYGDDLRRLEPGISPLRAALAVWGLGVDDIDMVSMHGTSTKGNDKNEAHVIQQQMQHLGRSQSRLIPVICQKSLTGHPKAAAAAWMLNGCLQAMKDGIIPRNAALDSVDEELRQFEYLAFPTQDNLKVPEIKAFLLNSFGFGQKGGQILGVASKYLFATLNREDVETYRKKTETRQNLAKRSYIHGMVNNCLIPIKNEGPYKKENASKFYLDPYMTTMAKG
ncbi:hypothetical protein BKA67DRAFT_566038 [Truncatella angustata]|uniref:beta-ketoacyl-[acyl-carrier-protein] synthase I n=1 Tax=Truncatella angustata TaxID=152316 RepID=A0A9P8ULE8_9PEZI|nr:uncharacterized protein BKA67DRAFT_566038 [Truncatella angustata]KAH6654700.1 hypothetical protein BKA67DRAFT_566038 [Truncatella angustata]